MNDMSIIVGIVSFFIILGVSMPFINEAFDTTSTINYDIDSFESDIGNDAESVSSLNAFTVLLSVLKMFFWTFGALPFWLDAFFLVLRITLVVTIARNIWVGGGS